MACSQPDTHSAWTKQNVLSLDGGGVRGYSILLILKRLMFLINEMEKENDPELNDESLKELNKPCNYFDYVAGTGTGGLIAIMLGRLRMDIDDTIKSYRVLGDEVFARPSKIGRLMGHRAFDTKKMEDVLQTIVDSTSTPGSRPFMSERLDSCKTIVCAARVDDVSTRPYLLRSYQAPWMPHAQAPLSRPGSGLGVDLNPSISRIRHPAETEFTIVQVARATLASPLHFRPVVIENQEFIEGGVGSNNPTLSVMREVEATNASDRLIDADKYGTIVNIGTGGRAVDRSLIPKRSTGSSKGTTRSRFSWHFKDRSSAFPYASFHHIDDACTKSLKTLRQKIQLPYFRFDAGASFSKVVLDAWRPFSESNLEAIEDWTERYLEMSETDEALRDCAEALVSSRRLRAQDAERWAKFMRKPPPTTTTSEDPKLSTQPFTSNENAAVSTVVEASTSEPSTVDQSRHMQTVVGRSSDTVRHFTLPKKFPDDLWLWQGATKSWQVHINQQSCGNNMNVIVMMAPTCTSLSLSPNPTATPSTTSNRRRTGGSSTAHSSIGGRLSSPTLTNATTGSTAITSSSPTLNGRKLTFADQPCGKQKDWAVLYCVDLARVRYRKRHDPDVQVHHYVGKVPRRGSYTIALSHLEEEEILTEWVASLSLRRAPFRAKFQHRFKRRLECFWRNEDHPNAELRENEIFHIVEGGRARSGESLILSR